MQYTDWNGTRCELAFRQGTFAIPSRHVLVICRYGGKWLLTKHTLRGLEFPGGKAEEGETLQEAAIRELTEETGFQALRLDWFAEYKVGGEPPFVKTVFIGGAVPGADFSPMETEGPVLVEELALDDSYSFLMKDDGMKELIGRAERYGKWND